MTDAYTAEESAVVQQALEQPKPEEALVFQPMPEAEATGQTAEEMSVTDEAADHVTIEEAGLAEEPEEDSIEKLIEDIIAAQSEPENEAVMAVDSQQGVDEEAACQQVAGEQQRFPNVFSWIPEGWSRYVIILVLIFFIWLVSPIAFIIGLIALYLWFKCEGDNSLC